MSWDGRTTKDLESELARISTIRPDKSLSLTVIEYHVILGHDYSSQEALDYLERVYEKAQENQKIMDRRLK